jgi:hypothetical protein
MTSQKLHKAYASVRQVVRAFTDNPEQCNFRVGLIVNNLYHDKLLSDAALIDGLVVERTEDGEDMSYCGACFELVLTNDLLRWGHASVCRACNSKWEADRDACTHRWTDSVVNGEVWHICDRCDWFIRTEILAVCGTSLPVQGTSFPDPLARPDA